MRKGLAAMVAADKIKLLYNFMYLKKAWRE